MPRDRLDPTERSERLTIQREKHNRNRREQYLDPNRREEILTIKRQNYHAQMGVETFDCRSNLSKLGEIGKVRKLLDDYNGPPEALSFTLEELSNAIGQSLQVLYRWQRKGQVPSPIMRAEVFNNNFGREGLPATQLVYTRPEVEAIIHALGEHKVRYVQYRASHTETRGSIEAGVQAARDAANITLTQID